MQNLYTIGVDIGGTNFRIGYISKDGELFGYEKCSVDKISGGDPTTNLADSIKDYINRYDLDGKVAAVCVGFPASVDKARETVLNAPNVKGFDGVPARRILADKLGLNVFIERDVNLLLTNDLFAQKIGSPDIIACYIGTGIGNAIMLGGQIFTGHNGVAGELGHIPFGDHEHVCACGNIGCSESLTGGVYHANVSTEIFKGTPISDLFLNHADSPEMKQYIERLGRLIAIEINIIDPEYLLLGGGVIQMNGFPKKMLEDSIMSHARKPLPYDNLKIVYSEATDGTGGVRGAGLYAWQKIN